MNLDDADSGAELKELVRRDLRLAADLNEGSPEDFEDDLRAGMTATGIPPPLTTSRRALLGEVMFGIVPAVKLR